MTTLDYYYTLLEHSLSGDVYGSLMYGLIAFAVVMLVTAVVAGGRG